MSPVLDIRGLRKSFALHHLGETIAGFGPVSFTVGAGEFVLLSGPNGAGKSSLLRTIHRTYLPSEGAILYGPDGLDLARAADVDIARLRRTEIGFVTQFLQARPRVSAERLVAEPARRDGDEAALEKARAALDAFGLRRALWGAYPATFSGGEQQKVNLARATLLPRRLLLLDEPTASLDAGARAALVDRLRDLKAAGTAMVGVFHHPGDVAALIDREVALPGTETLEEVPA
ncbi:MAG: ATP-binding cassette domain-containing protein [Pseudomonadota bacterium]